MRVELQKIGPDNLAACLALRVSPAQQAYIASNARSLEQAAELPQIARPFGLCLAGTMVGFAMLAFDLDNEDPGDRYWLWRFMIHAPLQRKGYGRLALAAVLDYFRAQGADLVTLSTKPDNAGALALYHRAGFRENGQTNGAEVVLKLSLARSAP